ncbi:MAG: hypothetical protein ACLFR7_00280 [Opitutales bacterium]
MNMLLRSFLSLSLGASLGALSASAANPLYAAPDSSAPVIAELTDPSALGTPQPVEEVEGWAMATYEGLLTGYVRVDEITPEGAFSDSAPVLAAAQEDAPLIATLSARQPPADLEIVAEEDGYRRIRFAGTTRVYLPATASPAREAGQVKEIVAPADEARPPADDMEAEAAVDTPPPAPLPPRLEPSVPDTSITLRGSLQSAGRRLLFFSPPHPYVLRDAQGNRIAWLDLEGAVLARPLPQMLDTEVFVYGEWRQREGSDTMILAGRTVRPAF